MRSKQNSHDIYAVCVTATNKQFWEIHDHMFGIKIIIGINNVLLRYYTLMNQYQPDIYFLQGSELWDR